MQALIRNRILQYIKQKKKKNLICFHENVILVTDVA